MRTTYVAPFAALTLALLLGAGKAAKAPKETQPAEPLPENIRAAAEKALPAATIISYEQQVEEKRHLFFVDMQVGDKTITVLFSGRAQYLGQVSDDAQEQDDLYIDKDTAPDAVKAAIAKYFGKTPIDLLFMEVEAEKFIFCAEQTMENKKTRWVSFNILGELMEEETEIDLKNVPAAVKTAISKTRPAGKITSVNLVKAKDKTTYVADVSEGKNKFEMTATPEGVVTENAPAEDAPATAP